MDKLFWLKKETGFMSGNDCGCILKWKKKKQCCMLKSDIYLSNLTSKWTLFLYNNVTSFLLLFGFFFYFIVNTLSL